MLQRALLVSILFGFGCGHAGAKLMTDTPILEYKAPDADEIAGIDTDEDEPKEEKKEEKPAPHTQAPAAAPAVATPAKGTAPAAGSAPTPKK
jgi:hypothetical protein